MPYLIGVNPSEVVGSAGLLEGRGYKLGDLGTDEAGNIFRYVQADGAITGEGYVVTMTRAYQAAMLSTSNDVYGDHVGVAQAAFADNDYGWVMVHGVTLIRGEQDALANSILGPTGDAGQVDDAAGSGLFIRNMILTTAVGGSDATAEGWINWPVIDTRPSAA